MRNLRITASDFEVLKVQFSIFTPGMLINTSKTLGVMLSSFSEVFDGEPLTIPTPKDFIDIPQIILKNKADSRHLICYSNRIDYTIATDESHTPDFSREIEQFNKIAQIYIGVNHCNVGRIACIVHKVFFCENPSEVLSKHFCKEEWTASALKRSEDFELHSFKKYSPKSYKPINSWVRCKCVTLHKKDKKEQNKVITKKAVFVEQDLNTLAEDMDNISYNPSEINAFFCICGDEMESIIQLYFPAGI